MPLLEVSNVAIRGISACVPPKVEENISLPFYSSKEEAEKVIKTSGVERRHIVSDGITAVDLCATAARKLISDLGWKTDTVDAICYVTQTPDYLNQPDSFLIHDQLNLKEDCMCLDLFSGCPGWVMGLMTISSVINHSSDIKRVLLLDGDNVSARTAVYDRESRPLFGDCGTATALEFDSDAASMFFDMGTRSKDGKSLITTRGASRYPFSLKEYNHYLRLLDGTDVFNDDDDSMDGMTVFSFGISEPPKSIMRLCKFVGVSWENVDKVVLHQSNALMLKKIIKKLKIVDMGKVPLSLRDYGNTTSASIPLTIVSQCASDYTTKQQKTVCCGFGTGLSWASAYFETKNIVCPDVITLKI